MKPTESQLAQYANYFRIGHNLNEFVIECCQLYEGGQEALVVSRLVLTPASAGQLQAVLEDSLRRHRQLDAKQSK
ncbi:DUF3467 domain-containing protein [Chitinimonas koreensis]|uniref:DUF3467 domain-containing protein n=1 Tax=Chitinimonas koreensis TaxID=356302 RepID=UPI000405F4B7|nr:DUF3467 domain-containing protein [Chitinimonas koreensis]QNM98663.1 DUF3467 domain-containing protein [Chitinimonas koreensis]